jgi:RHS repeat-associated protein
VKAVIADHQHWRTLKRAEERRFYYSASWQLIQEDIDEDYMGSPGVDRYAQQYWGIRYIDDAAARRRVDGQSESLYFHITDGQFSTVAVLDESAALQERVCYSAYGRATHHWPGDFNGDGYVDSEDENTFAAAWFAEIGDSEYDPDIDLNRNGEIDYGDLTLAEMHGHRGPLGAGRISDPFGPDNPIGYSGYVFNPETGLLLARHRYYNPSLGRWMSEDWLGYPDGMNRFEYARGNPSLYLDPTGLATAWEWMVRTWPALLGLTIDGTAQLVTTIPLRIMADYHALEYMAAMDSVPLSVSRATRAIHGVERAIALKHAVLFAARAASWSLAVVGTFLDLRDAMVATDRGDWTTAGLNWTQVIFGVGATAAIVAGALPAGVALGISILFVELIEATGIAEPVVEVLADTQFFRWAARQLEDDGSSLGISSTCEFWKERWATEKAKKCKSDTRLEGIRQAWKSNNCPGKLE